MKKALLVIILAIVAMGCGSAGKVKSGTLPRKLSYLKHIVQLSLLGHDGGRGLCTGVVVAKSGLILTARHCVEGNKAIYALTAAGNQSVHVLGKSLDADIAILSIGGWNYEPMPMCESDIDVDKEVCAVGRTFDNYLFEFECGVTTASSPEEIITAISVRPGFSGGPLIDVERKCLAGITYGRMVYGDTAPRSYHVGLGELKKLIARYR